MMRQRASSVAVFATLLAITGCGSDSAPSSPASGGAGGAQGGTGGIGGSAGGQAGSAGSGGGCTVPGTVSVEYALFGAAPDGHVVVFHRADGSVDSETTTDASGKASGTLQCGGLVTLSLSADVLWTLRAEPGDDIVLEDTPPDSTGVGDMLLDVAEGFAGASMYPLGCAGPPADLSDLTVGPKFAIRKYCLNPAGKFHELAVALDSAYHPLAFTFLKDITPAAPALTTVTLPTPWRTDFATFQVDVANAPAGFQGISLTTRPWLDGLTYYPDTMNAAFANGSASVQAKYPADFGSMLQYMVSVGSTGIEIRLHRRVANPPPTISLSAVDFPPAVSNATLDKTMPTRPLAAWQGDTSAADGVVIYMTYAPDGTKPKSWNGTVPPGGSSFSYPELPAALAEFVPTPATTYQGLEVHALSSSAIAGYSDFRQHHLVHASLYAVQPPLDDVSIAMARTQMP
jgi:hypothetical protein